MEDEIIVPMLYKTPLSKMTCFNCKSNNIKVNIIKTARDEENGTRSEFGNIYCCDCTSEYNFVATYNILYTEIYK